jgi:hypothetical protein
VVPNCTLIHFLLLKRINSNQLKHKGSKIVTRVMKNIALKFLIEMSLTRLLGYMRSKELFAAQTKTFEQFKIEFILFSCHCFY